MKLPRIRLGRQAVSLRTLPRSQGFSWRARREMPREAQKQHHQQQDAQNVHVSVGLSWPSAGQGFPFEQLKAVARRISPRGEVQRSDRKIPNITGVASSN